MQCRRTLSVTIGTTFLLIVWGGVVRRSGSGLGCPDWPLCHGRIIPPMELATWIEYIHRLLAAVVSVLVVLLVVKVFRSATSRRTMGWRVGGIFLLLVAQAVLGGMVVATELHPWLIAAHMALALAFFGMLIPLAMRVEVSSLVQATEGSGRPSSLVSYLGWSALLALYCQAILGALVSGYQAGLACPDFPTCQGQWWPPFQGLVGIHMAHRIGAVITTILICLFVFMSWNQRRLLAILFLLTLQIVLGIGNVLFGLPFTVDVAHLAVATALFGALCYARLVITSPSPSPASSSYSR